MSEQHIGDLIQKYIEGTATSEEVQQLLNWYHSASLHEVSWPGEKKEVYNRMLLRLQKETALQGGRVVRFPWLKVAAVLFIVLGAGYLMLRLTNPFSASYVTIVNPSGSIQLVQLPDSSKVWLNAASELRYAKNFTKHRDVVLAGEAYLEVNHDPAHPFTITAGEIETTVLGTSFNVKAYKEEEQTIVSLITGSVKITNHSGMLALLKPSMQLAFDRQRNKAITTSLDTASVLAWKRGRLQFEGETLAHIASALERWYDIKFIFTNPAMRNCRYYVGFDNTLPPEKMLSVMAELTGMNYSMNKDKKIISLSGKGCR